MSAGSRESRTRVHSSDFVVDIFSEVTTFCSILILLHALLGAVCGCGSFVIKPHRVGDHNRIRELPMKYVFDPEFPTDNPNAKSAVRRAFESWNRRFGFVAFREVELTNDVPINHDKTILITFSADSGGIYGNDILGVAFLTSVKDDGLYDHGVIQFVDNWIISSPEVMETVAKHEIGHFVLGSSHSSEPNCLMYFAAKAGDYAYGDVVRSICLCETEELNRKYFSGSK